MCKISIIIPVYNVENYLDDCLQSVLAQDFEDMEILCVEDGSTDSSPKILERYAAREKRLKIISYGKNMGLGYARNRAMEQAHGEYLYFLDSDDMIPPGKLACIYKIASVEHLDVLHYDMQVCYEEGTDSNSHLHIRERNLKAYTDVCSGQQLAYRMMMDGEEIFTSACVALWRRLYLEKYHLRFHEGVLHEDVAFSLLAFLLAQRIHMIPERCYIYRRRSNSITSKPGRENLRGQAAAFADLMEGIFLHKKKWTIQGIQVLCHLLEGQKRNVRHYLFQYGGEFPERITFEDFGDNFAAQFALRNGHCYLNGFLTAKKQKELRDEEEIVIYGAGQIGREIINLFEGYGILNYHLAVTTKKEKDAQGFMQMVHELREYQDLRDTALVIVAASRRYRGEMIREAHRLGFRRIVEYSSLM